MINDEVNQKAVNLEIRVAKHLINSRIKLRK